MKPPPRVELAPGYAVARVINGGWQLAADHGPGAPDRAAAVAAMLRLAAAGFTTFDCADIYTGVEELLGEVVAAWRRAGRDPGDLQIHTKFVPDRGELAELTRERVGRHVDRSLRRLGVDRLDLVQFHWWDFGVPGWMEAAAWLAALREAGKIRHLGVTNTDRRRLQELVGAGLEPVSQQVQYSLLDRRPEQGTASWCERHRITLVAYGTLAGGYLAQRYLGAAERDGEPADRSQIKYRLIVDEFGGWDLYQELLSALDEIARKHRVSVANVAVRWVLDRPAVGAVILGARHAGHLEENLRLFGLELDGEDRERLRSVCGRSAGPGGDVYELERRPGGRHAAILRTDLNRGG